ncbi:MAG: uracil-DNA glycosylase [Methylococcaceae bacterium]
MDNLTRLQYLEAMGIDVWVSRHQPLVADLSVVSAAVIDNESIDRVNLNKDKWNILQKEVLECVKCTLCENRTQTVFGVGKKNSDWMLIGEALGYNEDLQGKPFVGQAGLLLTEMIRAMGLERDSVYIANILKCKLPDEKKPKVEEIKACGDYLQRQIQLVQPKIILAIGRVAAQTLLETKEPLTKLRGVSHQLAGIPLIVVYHPAYLLRSLLEKRNAWKDIQLAIETYNQ